MDQQQRGQNATFYMGSMEDEAASMTEGRPIYKDVPFVRIFTPGDKDCVIDQPAWIHPSAQMAHNNRFPEQYRAFKLGQAEQVQGTPVELLPGVTGALVKELAYFNVRTIEQLASVSDGNAQKMGRITQFRQAAQKYLERAAGEAPARRLEEEKAKLQAQLDAQAAQIAALTAAMEQATKPSKQAKAG